MRRSLIGLSRGTVAWAKGFSAIGRSKSQWEWQDTLVRRRQVVSVVAPGPPTRPMTRNFWCSIGIDVDVVGSWCDCARHAFRGIRYPSFLPILTSGRDVLRTMYVQGMRYPISIWRWVAMSCARCVQGIHYLCLLRIWRWVAISYA